MHDGVSTELPPADAEYMCEIIEQYGGGIPTLSPLKGKFLGKSEFKGSTLL